MVDELDMPSPPPHSEYAARNSFLQRRYRRAVGAVKRSQAQRHKAATKLAQFKARLWPQADQIEEEEKLEESPIVRLTRYEVVPVADAGSVG